MNRQAALRAQGDSLDGDINRIRTRLDELGEERAAYQRMFARKRISEVEFDRRMDETENAFRMLQDDLEQLKTLRDDRAVLYSDGTVMLEGVLDGSEISMFDINGS
jgi:glutaredoxin 2